MARTFKKKIRIDLTLGSEEWNNKSAPEASTNKSIISHFNCNQMKESN